jgi:hypothetical protein
MIRRSILTLLFALLLIFGQQQSMVHAYVHSADWQQGSSNKSASNDDDSSDSKSTSHSQVCAKCVALANLGAAVGSQAHILNITTGQFQLSTSLHQSIISQRVLAYHSRAPPILA